MMRQGLLFAITCTVVALLTTAVYLPGLSGPFIYDDLTNIIYNKALRLTDLNVASLRDAAQSADAGTLGRQVTLLSFALNYYFTQFDIFYFKLTNLFIHLLIGAGLFQLTRRLLKRHEAQTGQPTHPNIPIEWLSLAVCALWLVHPLNLTAVLYVVQRMTSLSTLFIVLGLLGYVHGREQVIQGKARGYATIVVSMLVCGLLAVFSKESGALLPIYTIVIEAVFYRLSTHQRFAGYFKWFWYSAFVAPLLAVAVAIFLSKGNLLGLQGYQTRDFTLTERLLSEARALWFYLVQILAPDLSRMGSYHDDFAISRGLLAPSSTLASITGLAALAVIAMLGYRKHAILTFAITWFFAGHCLESTIVPLLLVQEHRNYLAQYGILLACVYYISRPSKKFTLKPGLRYGLLALYLVLIAGATYARSLQWKDEWTLYNVEVRNHPQSSRAHTMLAILLHDNHRNAEAEQHFASAALLAPREIEPMIRLVQHHFLAYGTIKQDILEELDDRIRHCPFSNITLWTFEALLIDSRKNLDVNRQIASLYEKLIGRDDTQLSDVWKENAYMVIGSNYSVTGNYQKALYFYNKASRINDSAFYSLASAGIYVKLKNIAEAQKLIAEVKTRNLPLSERDRMEMNRLEQIIRAQGKTNRND